MVGKHSRVQGYRSSATGSGKCGCGSGPVRPVRKSRVIGPHDEQAPKVREVESSGAVASAPTRADKGVELGKGSPANRAAITEVPLVRGGIGGSKLHRPNFRDDLRAWHVGNKQEVSGIVVGD